MADLEAPAEKPKGAGQPNRIKRLLSAHIRKQYGQLTNLILLHNKGLNSEQTFEIRSTLRNQGIRLHVVRNRLTLRAFRDLGLKEAEAQKLFVGPTALVDAEDPVLAARIALEFCGKFSRKLALVGGVIEGQILGPKEVEALSRSQTRPQLLAEVAGRIRGPGANLAASLLSPGRRVAGAVKALVAKQEQAEAEQPKAAAPAAAPGAAPAPAPA
jgi:large subunit ribosomal protein L10